MFDSMRSLAEEREETLALLREILIQNLHLDLEPDQIDADAALFGSGLGLDSVDAVELVVAIEDRFGLDFSKQSPLPSSAKEAAPSQGTESSDLTQGSLHAEAREASKAHVGVMLAPRRTEVTIRLFMRTLNSLADLILSIKKAA
jgi:acyl carrier protein